MKCNNFLRKQNKLNIKNDLTRKSKVVKRRKFIMMNKKDTIDEKNLYLKTLMLTALHHNTAIYFKVITSKRYLYCPEILPLNKSLVLQKMRPSQLHHSQGDSLHRIHLHCNLITRFKVTSQCRHNLVKISVGLEQLLRKKYN